jgi:hypothetical protein
MSLTTYKKQFDNAYQEVFQKTLVAKDIMNTRFEPVLKYGASVERVIFDISNVRVRSVTRGAASTIDTISDSSELLTVNLEKEAVFHISDGEVTQTGPLNPGEEIGKQVGLKVAIDLDARCFAEVLNALYSFDDGDLTTTTSTGTPITLSATTVPQMVSRMPAKLRNKNNQEVSMNMALVVDSYAASDIAQYLLGKNIDLAGYVFKNGYTGDISNAQMYVSENLTGTATLLSTGTFSDGDTVTIGGVVLTMKTTLGSTPGNVLIGADAAASITNLAAIINTPGTTTAQGVALSAANQLIFTDALKLTATATSATVLTIVGTGSGRLTLSETAANFSWSKNYINAYFGKKGAIDLVVQDLAPVKMMETTDRRGTNVFSSYLAGLKTFADGAKKFLNVKIAA